MKPIEDIPNAHGNFYICDVNTFIPELTSINEEAKKKKGGEGGVLKRYFHDSNHVQGMA